MTIYDRLVQSVENGEYFSINLETKSLRIGKEIVIEDKDYDDEDDTVNYYLGEFYDLCDDARVWLAI